MEVHAVDGDDRGRFGKRLVDLAVFEDAVPDEVGAGFVVEDAAVGERVFAGDDRLERFVVHLHQFGGVFGGEARFGDHGGDRLALEANLGDRQRIILDLARPARRQSRGRAA